MWTVVYISQSVQTAEKLVEVLKANALISRLRRSNSSGDEKGSCYEVLVPSTELEKAQDLMIENELF